MQTGIDFLLYIWGKMQYNIRCVVGEKIIHRTDIPKRSEKLPNYRTHKHTLYGKQEGVCNGCEIHFPFKIMEVDHIIPTSKGGTDHEDNLQLLCTHCNKVKGDRTQAELKAKLKKE